VCALTGIFSSLQIYLAARVWPTYNDFPNVETAFLDVCGRAGGPRLFEAMALTLFVACVGSTLTGQLGASRLLYGMGRDSVLPKPVFGKLNRAGTPVWNMILIAVVTIAGALTMNYEHAAELLNFGAFIAFMGVNLAVMRTFYGTRRSGQVLRDIVAPAAGFLFCLFIWISLPRLAKIIGAAWLAAGLIYLASLTRGFQRPPAQLDFTE
jgi:amino acid transporter